MAYQNMPAKPNQGGAWTTWGDTADTNLREVISDVPSMKADINTLQTSKAPIDSPTFTGTVSGVTKAMVGLGNVDNVAVASMTIDASQLTGTIDPARLPSGSTLEPAVTDLTTVYNAAKA